MALKWAAGIGGSLGVAGLVAWGMMTMGSTSAPGPTKSVRRPILAGEWYAGTAVELARQVDRLLTGASAEALPEGRPAYLIQPHAGYPYSGRAAATGLKSIQAFEVDRVIILAPSHRAAFRGAALSEATHFATPLGEVALDTAVGAALAKVPGFQVLPEAHADEHSIEIQLPLLQWAFGRHPALEAFGKTDAVQCPFTIVPIVMGDVDAKQAAALAQALKPHVGPKTLVLVSSDFTHYGRSFAYTPFTTDIKANLAKLDGGAVARILARDAAGFERYVAETGATICGRIPIGVLLRMLPATAKGKQLIYYTSGDVTGTWSHCVSYASVVFAVAEKAGATTTRAAAAPADPPAETPAAGGALTQAEQSALLKLARFALVSWVRDRRVATAESAGVALTPALCEKCGVFVTLKEEGDLRGCIGYVDGRVPLYQGVIENAVNAATRDPRFLPVSPRELDLIRIEISVMSPLRRISDPETVEVGRHGLYIQQGGYAGLLLPQVAPEQGWTREEFLVGICRKAGLPPDAWKTAELSVFTAQVFGEEPGAKG